jgi:hypothetical protein
MSAQDAEVFVDDVSRQLLMLPENRTEYSGNVGQGSVPGVV